MPLAKNRELIPISSQAHKHLRTVVDAMKRNGIPINGTLLVSQVLLAIPVPDPIPHQHKPKKAANKAQAEKLAA